MLMVRLTTMSAEKMWVAKQRAIALVRSIGIVPVLVDTLEPRLVAVLVTRVGSGAQNSAVLR
jgi:hypothetical protein